ncbi:MAG: hypothetical protein JJT94_05850 [Bernardetiaceae bacterium]|nr:hypothetical protein [Bernardetiaceae bacterium]
MKTTIIILTLFLFISTSEALFACSCPEQRTTEEEVKHADAIVVGIVLNKQFITLNDSTICKIFPHDTTMRKSLMRNMTIARYDFLVQEIYKGKITTDTLKVYTGIGGGDCGVRFQIGKKYIIYGENETYFRHINSNFKFPKEKNAFWTYNCLRTTTYYQNEITEIEKFAQKQKRKIPDK